MTNEKEKQEKSNIDIALKKGIAPEFIKTYNNTDCVVYAGLLDLAHKRGANGRKFLGFGKPEIVKFDSEKQICIIIACAKFEGDFEVSGIGYTSAKNIGDEIFQEHFVVVAATRAKARALKDALNIPLVSKEELNIGNSKTKKTDKNITISDKQKNFIEGLIKDLGKDDEFLSKILKKSGLSNIGDLKSYQADKLIKQLKGKLDNKKSQND